MYRLIALLMVVCPCKICLGVDTNLVRQTVHNHKQRNGIATPEEIAQYRSLRYGADDEFHDLGEQDGADYYGDSDLGSQSATDGEEWFHGDDLDNQEDDAIDWADDPVYNKLLPFMENLMGGEYRTSHARLKYEP